MASFAYGDDYCDELHFDDVVSDADIGYEEFCEDIAYGRLEKVKETIESGRIDIDACVGKFLGGTPLIEAIRTENFNVVKYLIQAGANVNLADKYEETPLEHLLSRRMFSRRDMRELIGLLVANGVDFDACKENILHVSFKSGAREIPEILVDYGVDLDARDDNGNTSFMAAVAQDNVPAMVLLLEREAADLDAMNQQGYNALFYAIEKGAKRAFNYLVDQLEVDINQVSPRGMNVLTYACLCNEPGFVSKLLKKGANLDWRTESAVKFYVKSEQLELFRKEEKILPGKSALFFANKVSAFECARLLKNAGLTE